MTRISRPSCAIALLLAGVSSIGTAAAQEAAEDATPTMLPAELDGTTLLPTLVVTATRTPEGVFETLSGSSALDADRLAIEMPGGGITDFVRLIPGLTTQTNADDPAVAINVRGLQDFGRVNVLVDGARQNFQKSGHSANGSFYLDPEMLKSVDVTRGPSSTIYGSGAIGGVVSFSTIDAEDVLDEGETMGGRLKSTFQSNGPGAMVHGEAAIRPHDGFEMLGAATWRSVDDYRSGDGQKVDSGQDLLSGLFKARMRPNEDHQLDFSAMRYRNSFDNGFVGARDTRVIADTITTGYRYTPASDWWDLTAKAYYSGTAFDQTELAGPDAGSTKTFGIKTFGFDIFNTSRFDTGALSHELTYGGDIFQDRVRTDDPIGSSDDLTPSGRRLAYGAYIQDQVSYDDWLQVVGALRYDAYRLDGDDISTDGGRLSPKITVGITPIEQVTIYGGYSEGYRAPAITETLIEGFHPPPVSAGAFFPNPNLKPEIARTIEAGVNLRFNDVVAGGDSLQAKFGIFRNNVDDYIDQVFVPFPIPGGYQYQNIARARIEGVEAELAYDSGRVFAGLSGAVLDGVDRDTGEQLTSVPPWRATGTLGFRMFDERLTVGSRVTLVGKKDAAATGFVGESYELVDIFARWQVNDRVNADLALNNIFDRQYTQYLDGDPSPGFNARLSVAVKF